MARIAVGVEQALHAAVAGAELAIAGAVLGVAAFARRDRPPVETGRGSGPRTDCSGSAARRARAPGRGAPRRRAHGAALLPRLPRRRRHQVEVALRLLAREPVRVAAPGTRERALTASGLRPMLQSRRKALHARVVSQLRLGVALRASVSSRSRASAGMPFLRASSAPSSSRFCARQLARRDGRRQASAPGRSLGASLSGGAGAAGGCGRARRSGPRPGLELQCSPAIRKRLWPSARAHQHLALFHLHLGEGSQRGPLDPAHRKLSAMHLHRAVRRLHRQLARAARAWARAAPRCLRAAARAPRSRAACRGAASAIAEAAASCRSVSLDSRSSACWSARVTRMGSPADRSSGPAASGASTPRAAHAGSPATRRTPAR
jgi:hypothetical protein